MSNRWCSRGYGTLPIVVPLFLRTKLWLPCWCPLGAVFILIHWHSKSCPFTDSSILWQKVAIWSKWICPNICYLEHFKNGMFCMTIWFCNFILTGLYEELATNWTVQRQDQYGFSSVACDMTIEQTLNRYSKTKEVQNFHMMTTIFEPYVRL